MIAGYVCHEAWHAARRHEPCPCQGGCQRQVCISQEGANGAARCTKLCCSRAEQSRYTWAALSHLCCRGCWTSLLQLPQSLMHCEWSGKSKCCKNTCSYGQRKCVSAGSVCIICGQIDASEPLVTAAGGEANDQAQLAKQDVQERLSTIQEGPEGVPSSNEHHPVLGMKSPMQRLRSQGIEAQLRYLATYITTMTNPAAGFFCPNTWGEYMQPKHDIPFSSAFPIVLSSCIPSAPHNITCVISKCGICSRCRL